MTAIIETEKLTKSYGAHRGIIDLDLVVNEGEAFGFLGPNGAGKTTTIRTLLDHLRPTSGRARVFGIDTRADPSRSTRGSAICQANSACTTSSAAATRSNTSRTCGAGSIPRTRQT